MIRLLVIGILAAVFCTAEKLPPVDESATDPSFAAFKTRLLQILERKDVKALLDVLHPHIKVNFGGDDGIAGFRRHWKLHRPAQSEVWTELATVLRLGATRDDPEFIAPYVFTRFPQKLDAFTHVAVVRKQAPLRAAPAASAAKLATLDYDILQLTGERRNGWTEVRTDSGQTGWVNERDIRSPLQYRAFFEKIDGKWKIMAFVAGD